MSDIISIIPIGTAWKCLDCLRDGCCRVLFGVWGHQHITFRYRLDVPQQFRTAANIVAKKVILNYTGGSINSREASDTVMVEVSAVCAMLEGPPGERKSQDLEKPIPNYIKRAMRVYYSRMCWVHG